MATLKSETSGIEVLVEISPEQHYALLKHANEDSPVYFRLKNAVKTEFDTILVPCSGIEAEMLLGVAKHFCPDAVTSIETAIKSRQRDPRLANRGG